MGLFPAGRVAERVRAASAANVDDRQAKDTILPAHAHLRPGLDVHDSDYLRHRNSILIGANARYSGYAVESDTDVATACRYRKTGAVSAT